MASTAELTTNTAADHKDVVRTEDSKSNDKLQMDDQDIDSAIKAMETVRKPEEQKDTADGHKEEGSPPPSPSADLDEAPKGFETTIELPRDILTAYILIRLNGTWEKLSTVSKGCIAFGFVFSWFAQFTVFASLITQTIEDFVGEFEVSSSGEDFLFNLVAISSLFMYLWKDLMAYYNSVWFYVNLKETEKKTGFNLSGRRLLGDAMKNITKIDPSKMAGALTGDKAAELLSFTQFRVFLVATFVLYTGFALYSLVEIAATESGITDKLEVAINIFFVLEIDDWACDLFVLGPGVIDDEDFDIDVILAESEEEHAKSVEKSLKWRSGLLVFSILFCYAMSYYHVALEDH